MVVNDAVTSAANGLPATSLTPELPLFSTTVYPVFVVSDDVGWSVAARVRRVVGHGGRHHLTTRVLPERNVTVVVLTVDASMASENVTTAFWWTATPAARARRHARDRGRRGVGRAHRSHPSDCPAGDVDVVEIAAGTGPRSTGVAAPHERRARRRIGLPSGPASSSRCSCGRSRRRRACRRSWSGTFRRRRRRAR